MPTFPWVLVIPRAASPACRTDSRYPVLPFAVGLYLPIHLNAGIMAGGVVRWFFERKKARTEAEEQAKKDTISRSILFTSGMIAGEESSVSFWLCSLSSPWGGCGFPRPLHQAG